MRPGIAETGETRRQHGGERGEAEDRERQDQDGQHRHLDLLGLDLLAEIFRRAPDHQPGDEHRDDGEEQHAVKAGADAAEDDLAQHDIDHRDHAAQRHEAVMHGVDGAAGSIGGDGREERRNWRCRSGPPCLPYCRRPAARSAPDRHEARRRPDCRRPRPNRRSPTPARNSSAHHREDRPALALDCRPCGRTHWSAPRRCEKISTIWTRLVSAFGILEGMGRIGVEEAAAIGAHHLDDFLRGDRALRDQSAWRLPASSRRYRRPDSAACPARRRTGRRRSRSAAGRRACSGSDRPRNCRSPCAERRAKPRISATASAMPVAAETKLCTVSPAIWIEIAHGGFGHIGLPVGVGDEADRGVEGQMLARPRGKCLRVEGQDAPAAAAWRRARRSPPG